MNRDKACDVAQDLVDALSQPEWDDEVLGMCWARMLDEAHAQGLHDAPDLGPAPASMQRIMARPRIHAADHGPPPARLEDRNGPLEPDRPVR